MKLCRLADLIGDTLTESEVERIFMQTMLVSKRRLDVQRFQVALSRMAQILGLSDEELLCRLAAVSLPLPPPERPVATVTKQNLAPLSSLPPSRAAAATLACRGGTADDVADLVAAAAHLAAGRRPLKPQQEPSPDSRALSTPARGRRHSKTQGEAAEAGRRPSKLPAEVSLDETGSPIPTPPCPSSVACAAKAEARALACSVARDLISKASAGVKETSKTRSSSVATRTKQEDSLTTRCMTDDKQRSPARLSRTVLPSVSLLDGSQKVDAPCRAVTAAKAALKEVTSLDVPHESVVCEKEESTFPTTPESCTTSTTSYESGNVSFNLSSASTATHASTVKPTKLPALSSAVPGIESYASSTPCISESDDASHSLQHKPKSAYQERQELLSLKALAQFVETAKVVDELKTEAALPDFLLCDAKEPPEIILQPPVPRPSALGQSPARSPMRSPSRHNLDTILSNFPASGTGQLGGQGMPTFSPSRSPLKSNINAILGNLPRHEEPPSQALPSHGMQWVAEMGNSPGKVQNISVVDAFLAFSAGDEGISPESFVHLCEALALIDDEHPTLAAEQLYVAAVAPGSPHMDFAAFEHVLEIIAFKNGTALDLVRQKVSAAVFGLGMGSSESTLNSSATASPLFGAHSEDAGSKLPKLAKAGTKPRWKFLDSSSRSALKKQSAAGPRSDSPSKSSLKVVLGNLPRDEVSPSSAGSTASPPESPVAADMDSVPGNVANMSINETFLAFSGGAETIGSDSFVHLCDALALIDDENPTLAAEQLFLVATPPGSSHMDLAAFEHSLEVIAFKNGSDPALVRQKVAATGLGLGMGSSSSSAKARGGRSGSVPCVGRLRPGMRRSQSRAPVRELDDRLAVPPAQRAQRALRKCSSVPAARTLGHAAKMLDPILMVPTRLRLLV